MINAEELDVTSGNVDQLLKSEHPGVRRLLGLESLTGKGLGLNDDWRYQVIKQVGNYGEVFEENVGEHSQLKIARGANALWTEGGLMYAPPLR